MTPPRTSRFRGCLLGLAVGDAVGTAVEFRPRGAFAPVADMVGGGPFGLRAGEWTDDTSMALCLAASLAETGVFDPRDQMERYVRWWREGYMSSTGRCFDIGGTTASALREFERTGEPCSGSNSPGAAGNGCIMRLAPVPMFCAPDVDEAERLSGLSSRTTHGAEECVDASRLLGRMLCRALEGGSKEDVLGADAGSFQGASKVVAIARGEWRGKARDSIKGSGYVVDCLEAALWCFERTDDFADAVLEAANLGDDADTTAAVTGQIAGAFYGEGGIPDAWPARLAMADLIRDLADRLCAHAPSEDAGAPEANEAT